MNQICKVCGEPAAGFHFGAFTCEGCKSFFGRTYNNISSLSDCKNNGRCVINKKTRTSCKSCRLRKCLLVGMSKSGSRYGRRSNWFKIHFLMQNSNNNNNNNNNTIGNIAGVPTSSMPSISNIDTWEKLSNGSVTSKKCSKDKCFLLSRRSENNSPQSNILPDIEMNQGVNEVQPEIRSAMQRKFNGEIIVNPERKDLDSPNPSSSDSHSSDSSVKENGETTFFPSYVTGSLYPKDLLSLYNIPALGQHRLPPYINPASLASRFLYPYYPNLLSLYSRSQYIDTIISEAKSAQSQTTKSKPSICSRSEDTETTASKDFQPPLKALKRNPSCSPPMSYLESLWSTNSSPSYPSPTASPKAWKPSSSCHDSKQVVKSEHKGNETTETHNQNSPMDLSVRTKALNGEELTEHGKTDEESDESVQEENYKVAFLIDEIVKERKSSKTEQQIPLDLSGFKT